MDRNFKSLSEALYADSDYLTKLANKPSMREYCQDIINATVDMNRAAFALEHPKEKTGKWIYTGDYITDGMLKCTSCGYEHDVADRFLYCPNCGARMVSE